MFREFSRGRFFRPAGLRVFSRSYPRLAPLRQAQGKLWAAFCRRFAANTDLAVNTDLAAHTDLRSHAEGVTPSGQPARCRRYKIPLLLWLRGGRQEAVQAQVHGGGAVVVGPIIGERNQREDARALAS